MQAVCGQSMRDLQKTSEINYEFARLAGQRFRVLGVAGLHSPWGGATSR